MISFNYNKKQAYLYAYEIIPKREEIDFLKKIFLLEKLFSFNVDSIHYHLNKEDVTYRQFWSNAEKKDKPLITYFTKESNYPDLLKQEKLLHLITLLDDMNLMIFMDKHNLPLKHNDYEQFVFSYAENFLCLPEITKENRFDFYFQKAPCIFHPDILVHVYDLIECLEHKRKFVSPEIEVFDKKFQLLPYSLEEITDFPLLRSFDQIDDFGFMNVIDNHILYALKLIFSKYNDYKGALTIFVNHVEQKIETSHTLDNNTAIIKTEDDALLVQHRDLEIRHKHTLDLETMDKEKIMEMLKEIWANLHAAHGQSFTITPDLPEQLSHVEDIIFSYVINTQKKSLMGTISKQSRTPLISEKNKRI